MCPSRRHHFILFPNLPSHRGGPTPEGRARTEVGLRFPMHQALVTCYPYAILSTVTTSSPSPHHYMTPPRPSTAPLRTALPPYRAIPYLSFIKHYQCTCDPWFPSSGRQGAWASMAVCREGSGGLTSLGKVLPRSVKMVCMASLRNSAVRSPLRCVTQLSTDPLRVTGLMIKYGRKEAYHESRLPLLIHSNGWPTFFNDDRMPEQALR